MNNEFDRLFKGRDIFKKEETIEKRTDNLSEEIKETDLAEIEKKFFEKYKIPKKEQKFYKKRDTNISANILPLFFISFFILLFICAYLFSFSDPLFMFLLSLLGSILFLPIGIFFGYLFTNPFIRCKILRKLTKKDYGIVFFIGKGNRLFTKTINFTRDILTFKDGIWVLEKNRIYQFAENPDTSKIIDPDAIHLIVDTVPVIFLDLNKRRILTFQKEESDVHPTEISAIFTAWIKNQLMKGMFLRKRLDVYFILLIIISFIAVALSYMTYNRLNDLEKILTSLQQFGNFTNITH